MYYWITKDGKQRTVEGEEKAVGALLSAGVNFHLALAMVECVWTNGNDADWPTITRQGISLTACPD